MEKPDLKNFTLAQLTDHVVAMGLPAFRGKQIFSWLYRPGTTGFEQMTDIAKDLRTRLAEETTFSRLEPTVIERSQDGTVKYGFTLTDGKMIETVLIPEEDRNTICVSSQVGCAMGCTFCLTGTMGFSRNLTTAEIINQVCAVRDHLLAEGKGLVNNLVFMGMGEPLANFDNLITALDILLEQRGLDFSSRRITVSTCGLVPKLIELGEKTAVNLAISLHSIDNELRNRLMPINKKYGVEELLAACRELPLPNRRRIMFEYILLKGINDSEDTARRLAAKLKGLRCKINLLPFNETEAMEYQRPDDKTIEQFQQILWDAGYSVFLRNSRGADISAACGQLAGKKQD